MNSALGCPSWSVGDTAGALIPVGAHVKSLYHHFPRELSVQVLNILPLCSSFLGVKVNIHPIASAP